MLEIYSEGQIQILQGIIDKMANCFDMLKNII